MLLLEAGCILARQRACGHPALQLLGVALDRLTSRAEIGGSWQHRGGDRRVDERDWHDRDSGSE